MGIDGPACVLAIEPCPEIEPGRGRVITGTFTTARCSVLELRLSNGEVLEPTPPHRFFSENRQDWVTAGELRVGECLRTASGQAATVELIGLKAGEHRVYNLEVEQEHQFYVGETGVLVHNAYEWATGRGTRWVAADETELGQAVLQKRFDEGISPARNCFAVQLEGENSPRVFVSEPGFHSEEVAIRDLPQDAVVLRAYSERTTCTSGPSCFDQLLNDPRFANMQELQYTHVWGINEEQTQNAIARTVAGFGLRKLR